MSFLLLHKRSNSCSNKIAILKLDGIGDYILFRNFLDELKKSEKFYNFEFIGIFGSNLKEISQILDAEYFSKFIFIDKNKFIRNIFYFIKAYKFLIFDNYYAVINPTVSRDFYLTDRILKILNSHEKYCISGSNVNYHGLQNIFKYKFHPSYQLNTLIDFEFFTYKLFFEFITNKKSSINSIKIETNNLRSDITPPTSQYIIFFIGASSRNRKWPIGHFNIVTEYILNTTNLNVIFCGDDSDLLYDEYFVTTYKSRFLNLIGKTSITDLLLLIKSAKILVSNETSAVHMACALGTEVITIYNGSHFGRFTPYPKSIFNKYNLVSHPSISINPEEYKIKSNMLNFSHNNQMGEISPNLVIDILEKILARR